jgi:hypothetical protein
MRNFDELIMVVVALFLLAYAVKAETINLTYAQCYQFNDTNGTMVEVCAPIWSDLNITDVRMNLTLTGTAPYSYSNSTWNLSVGVAAPPDSPSADCRLNITIVGTAPYVYTNPTANVSFYIAAPKYNQNTSLDFGQNFTNADANISCSAPQFPAINRTYNFSGNVSYSYPDPRYNLTIITQCDESYCKANIDKTLAFGEEYFNPLCNIYIKPPAKPTVNETATLEPGEVRQNSELMYSYTCKDTRGEAMMCVAEQVLLNDTIRQMHENTSALFAQLQSVNGTLFAREEELQHAHENISVSTAMLTAGDKGDKTLQLAATVGTILLVGIAGIFYIRNYLNRKPMPPSGVPEEPLMVEATRRTDEKISARFAELDKKHKDEIASLNDKLAKKVKADQLRNEAEKLDKELGGL